MKKAIINFFRAIFRRNIQITNNPEKPFELIVITEGAEKLSETLGISEERADELGEAAEKAVTLCKDVVTAANMVAPMCKHINEYFFCTFVINSMARRLSNPLGGLLSILSQGGPPPQKD